MTASTEEPDLPWLVDGCLPGLRRTCAKCNGEYVYARTVSTERGRGANFMSLDVRPDPDGSLGARMEGRSLVCRDFTDSASHEPGWARVMPHFIACEQRLAEQFVDEVEAFLHGHPLDDA